MTNGVVIGAYWGDRPESIESCVERLAGCLDSLADIEARFGTWYSKKSSRKAGSGASLSHTAETLSQILLAGRNRRDFGGTVNEQLGFSMNAWNGDYERSASLSVFCGGYAGVAGLVNHFVISTPDSLDELVEAMDLATAKRLLTTIAGSWRPDWATIATDEMREEQRPLPRQPIVGIATYLGRARHVTGDNLPGWASIEMVDHGTLLLVDTDPRETLRHRTLVLAGALGDALRPAPLVAAE